MSQLTLLTVIAAVWFTISVYRTYHKCKEKSIPFNPLKGGFLDYAGFIISAGIGVAFIISVALSFLK